MNPRLAPHNTRPLRRARTLAALLEDLIDLLREARS